MKKTFLIFLTFLISIITVTAQDFPYGGATSQEFLMKRYDKDTAAHAVVLNEYGTAKIDAVSDNSIKIVYQHHIKIKIFDGKGFSHGNVVITLGNNETEAETLEAVRGITTYSDDEGREKTVSLNPTNVYRIKLNKFITQARFAMPGMRNGCIVEYDYITYSPFLARFPKWNFQSDIPKVHSLYDVHQPGSWTYNVSLRGSLELSRQLSEVEHNCFSGGGASSSCAHLVFGMDDIPAFVPETDMTSPYNFLSSVNFQLASYQNLSTGAVTNYARDWPDVDHDFKQSDTFGAELHRKGFFKTIVAPLIEGKTDSLEKAKAIFRYVQQNIRWNFNYGTNCLDGVRKAIEKHSGNCAEVNLALVDALNAAGLPSEPVLLSTRDNGFVNKLYPVTNGFNYVIAKVDIANKSYLLDATDVLMPFGILPFRCLNDQGRVMSMDKPSYWIDINTGQKRVRNFLVDLTLMPEGKLKGTLIELSTGYDAYEKRKEIKRFNSPEEYVQSLDEKSSKLRLLKGNFSNLDSLDEPLTERYVIELNDYQNTDLNHLTFNQFLFDHVVRNPYQLRERSYPVDKGMALTETFSVTLHLPRDYVVEAPPREIDLTLPESGARFQSFYQPGAESFTYSHIFQFNKAIFQPAEYAALKEFFNKIILLQKDQIRLNKKS